MALDTCYGLGPENYLGYAKELEAVTARDVLELANALIDFERETLVTVGP